MTEKKQQPVKLQETIEHLQQELQEQRHLTEERLNQLKYLQADFDNYRKHFEKEKEHIIQLANEHLIRELLQIEDDITCALKQMNDEHKKGLQLMHKNFLNILENHGVKQIDCVGKKFDPHFHEVVSKKSSDKEEGIILEEWQRGFMLKSKVVRPAKVIVAEYHDKKQ